MPVTAAAATVALISLQFLTLPDKIFVFRSRINTYGSSAGVTMQCCCSAWAESTLETSWMLHFGYWMLPLCVCCTAQGGCVRVKR